MTGDREPLFLGRPSEEDERRALRWLTDQRANGGPLERRFAASVIDTLAWFEAHTLSRAIVQAQRDEAALKVAQINALADDDPALYDLDLLPYYEGRRDALRQILEPQVGA